jgi:hypothetical protein
MMLSFVVSKHENANHLARELQAFARIVLLLQSRRAAHDPLCYGARRMGARDEASCCLS